MWACCLALQSRPASAATLEADMRIGPLRRLFALAPLNRFHHLKWAGVGDVNFVLFTNGRDHLLRTAVYELERRFTSEDLGIGKQADYPTGNLGQLVAPFRAEPRQYGSSVEPAE